jgi:hypothetical protein
VVHGIACIFKTTIYLAFKKQENILLESFSFFSCIFALACIFFSFELLENPLKASLIIGSCEKGRNITVLFSFSQFLLKQYISTVSN